MNQHTPGEWRVKSNVDGRAIIVADSANNIVCRMELPHRFGSAQPEANARLIAAAPDLLEALRIAIRALEDNNIDESMAGEFEILTDAIAKANGGVK